MPKIIEQLYVLKRFITYDIWRLKVEELSFWRRFLYKTIKIVILTYRGMFENQFMQRASSLTFYSLMSIVPVLAMAFGVAKGFGFEKKLQAELYASLPGQEEILNKVVEFAYSLLNNTKGGIVAGVGVAILFWMVLKVLSNIELAFNNIWKIEKNRSFIRKLTDYLTIMMICPILVILSSSISVLIISTASALAKQGMIQNVVDPILSFSVKLIPYGLIWILFTLLYMVMPNRKIRIDSAFVAALIAGTIYQVSQWAYIKFQVGAMRYNAIYGSFAVLPLFLTWLQISWVIVLLGAEVSYAYETVEEHEFEPDCQNLNHDSRKLVAVGVAHLIVKNFEKGGKPYSESQLKDILGLPICLIRQAIDDLIDSEIIYPVNTNGIDMDRYGPAKDIHQLKLYDVMAAIDRNGQKWSFGMTPELTIMSTQMDKFGQELNTSPANRLLKDI